MVTYLTVTSSTPFPVFTLFSIYVSHRALNRLLPLINMAILGEWLVDSLIASFMIFSFPHKVAVYISERLTMDCQNDVLTKICLSSISENNNSIFFILNWDLFWDRTQKCAKWRHMKLMSKWLLIVGFYMFRLSGHRISIHMKICFESLFWLC